MTKYIALLTAALVSLIALGSFVLSYNALYQVALSNSIDVRLAWLWPLLVDAPLVVFSLCAIVAYFHSEDTWQLWSLVAFYVVITMGGNIIHAWPDMLPLLATRIIVTCIPPLSLLLSFEVLMAQFKNSIKRQSVTLALTQELQRVTHEHAQEVEELQAEVDSPVTYRRNLVASMLESGKTQKAIASELEVSISTVRKDISALNGVGK